MKSEQTAGAGGRCTPLDPTPPTHILGPSVEHKGSAARWVVRVEEGNGAWRTVAVNPSAQVPRARREY